MNLLSASDVTQKHIDLFRSVFRGREDVYAFRWEKDGENGYMPAYDLDWDEYKRHKAQGGSFRDFQNKKPQPLTDSVIKDHILGKKIIGVYPLLTDNTSYFIAADFDGTSWVNESRNFLKVCQEYNIPAYLERSRSGKGGHVWIFFMETYPAFKSRQIVFELIRKALNISAFEKEISFDRLFPNQDYHTKQGLGNLIALPLNGRSILQGNSCFVRPDSLEPFEDQWDFLSQINKLKTSRLNELYSILTGRYAETTSLNSVSVNGNLQIIIRNQIYIHRRHLNPALIRFIRDNLNFKNADYIIRQKTGKSVYKTEQYFKLIEESDNEIMLPRGFVTQLVDFCKKEKIVFQIIDDREKLPAVKFTSGIKLYDYQEDALEITDSKDYGVLVAPAGSGKTMMGLELITRKQQPALIIVHRKQLFDQWLDRIQAFQGISKKDIGQISTGKYTVGKQITVGMIQSLSRIEDWEELKNAFGTIIVDECHHIPAKTFRETIVRFNCFYLYGLTATPQRKNNDEKLIYVYIGEILSEIPLTLNEPSTGYSPARNIQVKIRETGLSAPFNYMVDNFETLSRILIYDSARNQMIVEDITAEVNCHKRVLVLTERKDHVNVLNLYLKDKFETITITGEDSASSRKSKLEQIKLGHFQVLIATGQLIGEGMDINTLECLSLVYPFAFEGKLIQYIGRVQRSEKAPVIYDYRDSKIDFFEKLFKKRNRYYKRLMKYPVVRSGADHQDKNASRNLSIFD